MAELSLLTMKERKSHTSEKKKNQWAVSSALQVGKKYNFNVHHLKLWNSFLEPFFFFEYKIWEYNYTNDLFLRMSVKYFRKNMGFEFRWTGVWFPILLFNGYMIVTNLFNLTEY